MELSSILCNNPNGKRIWNRADTCMGITESLCNTPGTHKCFNYVHVHAQSLQSCPTLCNGTDCGLPGSSVHGILQGRILEWGACSPPGDLPDLGIEPTCLTCPRLACRFFTTNATWESTVSTVQFSCSVVSNSLWPHGLQHERLPCPSPP